MDENTIRIIESPIDESVLHETHKDHENISSGQVRDLLEKALLKDYVDVLDIKIETVDRNYNTDMEIVSGDAVVRIREEDPSTRVQYEVNADEDHTEADYDMIEVLISKK